jgi:hypothetical protein
VPAPIKFFVNLAEALQPYSALFVAALIALLAAFVVVRAARRTRHR